MFMDISRSVQTKHRQKATGRSSPKACRSFGRSVISTISFPLHAPTQETVIAHSNMIRLPLELSGGALFAPSAEANSYAIILQPTRILVAYCQI